MSDICASKTSGRLSILKYHSKMLNVCTIHPNSGVLKQGADGQMGSCLMHQTSLIFKVFETLSLPKVQRRNKCNMSLVFEEIQRSCVKIPGNHPICVYSIQRNKQFC